MTSSLLSLLRNHPVRGVRALHYSLPRVEVQAPRMAFAGVGGAVAFSGGFAGVVQLLFSLLLGCLSSSPLAREQDFLRTSFWLLCWHLQVGNSSVPSLGHLSKRANSGELITVLFLGFQDPQPACLVSTFQNLPILVLCISKLFICTQQKDIYFFVEVSH